MPRTVAAMIEPNGQVRLLEPVTLDQPRRALVVILDDKEWSEEPADLDELSEEEPDINSTQIAER